MADDATLRAYYEARASYYDQGYRGEAPPWVARMVTDLREAVRGRRVLEIACGTGHWTRHAALVAESVTAVDPAPAMRAIATDKLADLPNTTVVDGDAYDLRALPGRFTAGLAMQWLSHVPAARRHEFFTGWHARLAPGSVIFLGDNQLTGIWAELLRRAPGADGAQRSNDVPSGADWREVDDLSTSDAAEGDTYEPRELPNGAEYVILKNYFTEDQLREILAPYGNLLTLTMDTHWWWCS